MENITPEQFIELYERISKLADKQTEKALANQKEEIYHSAETDKLAAAMAKAQGEYPTSILRNNINSHTKNPYADLDDCLKIIRPILARNEIFFSQYTVPLANDTEILHTKITHSSGQWFSSRTRLLPARADLEANNSEFNAKKRNQGLALLGITTSNEDDDGEEAMKLSREDFKRGTAINHKLSMNKEPYDLINQHQYTEICNALKGWPDEAENVMFTNKITSLADLPKDRYAHTIKQIRENILQRTRPKE
jgi:hypothetical protein